MQDSPQNGGSTNNVKRKIVVIELEKQKNFIMKCWKVRIIFSNIRYKKALTERKRRETLVKWNKVMLRVKCKNVNKLVQSEIKQSYDEMHESKDITFKHKVKRKHLMKEQKVKF